jgi:hypothetical protein
MGMTSTILALQIPQSESGNIIINGGTISVKQKKAVTYIGSAAIGGGISFDGHVTINGGHVTAEAYAGATSGSVNSGAGIGGGGYTDANAKGGNGYVTINGGAVYAYSAHNDGNFSSTARGAGIGGGANGKGIVKITGGYVNANHGNHFQGGEGAGIGGGGNGKISGGATVGNGVGEVLITGGTVMARSNYGAAIGNGSFGFRAADEDVNYVAKGYERGYVIIDGGTVSTYSSSGFGIGTGALQVINDPLGKGYAPNKHRPNITISTNADVECFGVSFQKGLIDGYERNKDSAEYGIPGGYKGDSYFVNVSFYTTPTPKTQHDVFGKGDTIAVYEEGNMNMPIRVTSVESGSDAYFLTYSFATQEAKQKIYNIYLGKTGYMLKELYRGWYKHGSIYTPSECDGTQKCTPTTTSIFSQITMNQWHGLFCNYNMPENMATFFMVEYGKAQVGGKYIKEYFYDISTGTSKLMNIVSLIDSDDYDKYVPDVDDYIALGYKKSTKPANATDFTEGIGPVIIKNSDATTIKEVYFVYKPCADITVSKKVTGDIAPEDDVFEFTIRIKDEKGNLVANKEINISGDPIPDEESITLDNNGECDFTLSHAE